MRKLKYKGKVRKYFYKKLHTDEFRVLLFLSLDKRFSTISGSLLATHLFFYDLRSMILVIVEYNDSLV